MPKRILVTGSRHWTDKVAIADALDRAVEDFERPGVLDKSKKLDGIYILIHGDCEGADRIAAEYWLGRPVQAYPANWAEFGKAAGPIRNQRMVNLGADICLAFPTAGSRGTWDCVRRAREAGIPVEIIEESKEVTNV
ncbi:SLOG family protein [Amycolatopsis kentuckyensis]|uniref:SLOG family protein n=1 Tax=Amycolatopsis kentuckyensis TaxID=218823 RepID=UPI000A36489E|nr:SLOG family protein [Amycolatopsis kentuckyensis]